MILLQSRSNTTPSFKHLKLAKMAKDGTITYTVSANSARKLSFFPDHSSFLTTNQPLSLFNIYSHPFSLQCSFSSSQFPFQTLTQVIIQISNHQHKATLLGILISFSYTRLQYVVNNRWLNIAPWYNPTWSRNNNHWVSFTPAHLQKFQFLDSTHLSHQNGTDSVTFWHETKLHLNYSDLLSY